MTELRDRGHAGIRNAWAGNEEGVFFFNRAVAVAIMPESGMGAEFGPIIALDQCRDTGKPVLKLGESTDAVGAPAKARRFRLRCNSGSSGAADADCMAQGPNP